MKLNTAKILVAAAKELDIVGVKLRDDFDGCCDDVKYGFDVEYISQLMQMVAEASVSFNAICHQLDIDYTDDEFVNDLASIDVAINTSKYNVR